MDVFISVLNSHERNEAEEAWLIFCLLIMHASPESSTGNSCSLTNTQAVLPNMIIYIFIAKSFKTCALDNNPQHDENNHYWLDRPLKLVLC